MTKSIEIVSESLEDKIKIKIKIKQVSIYTYFCIHEENDAKEGLDEVVISLFQWHAHSQKNGWEVRNDGL